MKTKNLFYSILFIIGFFMFIGMSIYCLYILSIKDILALFIAFILLISITAKNKTNEARN